MSTTNTEAELRARIAVLEAEIRDVDKLVALEIEVAEAQSEPKTLNSVSPPRSIVP